MEIGHGCRGLFGGRGNGLPCRDGGTMIRRRRSDVAALGRDWRPAGEAGGAWVDYPLTCSSEWPCPACGYFVFSEPPGSYEMCPVCGWEDDPVQVRHPRMRGGANGGSIFDYQQDLPEDPAPFEFRRDPYWRRLGHDEAQLPNSTLGSVNYDLDYYQGELPYYWRKERR